MQKNTQPPTTMSTFALRPLLCAVITVLAIVPTAAFAGLAKVKNAPEETACGGMHSDAYLKFSLSMAAAASGYGARNAIVSPSSVEATLAMMSQGATEPVRKAAADIFAYKDTEDRWLSICRLDELRTQKVSSRVALVIGNADYEHLPSIASPLKDAVDISAAMGRLGFKVTEVKNADQQTLLRAFEDFGDAASGAEVAVVFYAGHGIEINGRNYLVPVDAQWWESEQDSIGAAVSLDQVLRTVDAVTNFGLVILDSSRDDPFKTEGSLPTTGLDRLKPAQAGPPSGTLIAYAGRVGQPLQDGKVVNSPYTAALLSHMEEPELDVGLMFRKVSKAVKLATNDRQEPVTYGSLPDEPVYLAGESPRHTLNRANAVFVDHSLDLYPAFQIAVTNSLGAHVEQLEFAEQNAVTRINTWVSAMTGNTVPKLLDQLDPDERLVMASALYFKGEWNQTFDRNNTVQAPFYPETGEAIDVAFMHSDDYPAFYHEDENFRAIEMRYKATRSGDVYALRLVLPRERMAAKDALERLQGEPVWFSNDEFHDLSEFGSGRVKLPRLTLEGQANLLPLLRDQGFGDLLTTDTAFAGIASPTPQLERIIQAAQLTIDERGTEGGAANAAVFSTRSGFDSEKAFEIALDRPFALALRNVRSNELLFVGWVANPHDVSP